MEHRSSPAAPFVFVRFHRALGSILTASAVLACLLAAPPAAWALSDPASSWFVDMNPYSRSAHASLTCEQCHGGMGGDESPHPDERDPEFLKVRATRRFDYAKCGTCHADAYRRYLQGVHAKALKEEKSPENPEASEKGLAPSCGECHSAHYAAAGQSRLETGLRMTEVCGACHPAQKQSYLDGKHGRLAIHLKSDSSAYCSDCHGAHITVSLKEREQALTACSHCHPRAQENFTSFVIHASMEGIAEKGEDKHRTVVLIHRIKSIAAVIVFLVIVFFFGHTFLWILRELHEKLRKQ